MRVAIVYDRVNKWGGAERVLLALHKIFPDAPLYTSVYHPQKAPWADVFKVNPSFLQKVPFAPSKHELYPVFMPLAFESFSFDDYDVVISVTSEAANGVITKPHTRHICYCLTPTRYLWSGYKDYFSNIFFKAIAYPAVSYLRTWDIIAANRPDAFIAISEEVKKRIYKYYKKEAEVIYPPVDLGERVKGKAESKSNSSPFTLNASPFFLIVSRLVPYKRIDLAIQACNDLKLLLRIIGNGSDEKRLKEIAGPTIEFLGNLTDSELVGYYESCSALIFPGEEDFGISIVEAQQFGKPVIAFRGGGALETILEGKTGMLFYPQTKRALKEVLKKFDTSSYNAKSCVEQAEKFGFEIFRKNFLLAVNKSY